ncbi:hypothetical protein UlMin_018606 [Ulmus minor]
MVDLHIAGRKVYRILIDNGSSTNILFKSTFNKMNLIGAKIETTISSLSGFTGDIVPAEGILNLPLDLRTSPCQHIQSVDFVVVDCPSLYNAIISRPTLNKIRAVTSTYHLLVKFLTIGGIDVLKGNQTESREIYEAVNRATHIQGIRNLSKPYDETLSTKTSNNTQPVSKSEKVETTKVPSVNLVHDKDDTSHPNIIMIGSIPCLCRPTLNTIMIDTISCPCLSNPWGY